MNAARFMADLLHPMRAALNGRYLRLPAGWNRREAVYADRTIYRSNRIGTVKDMMLPPICAGGGGVGLAR